MKKNGSTDLWQLRVLLGLGIVAIFAVLAIPTYLTIRIMRSDEYVQTRKEALGIDAEQQVSSGGLLGEMGSVCGGSKRLPCKPGLVCDAAMDTSSLGACVKDPKAVKGVIPSQFGEACGDGLPVCGAGLFCRKDAQRNQLQFCSKLNETAPFIVSVKNEGMSPADGGYNSPAGSEVVFHVQTTNVDRLKLRMKGVDVGEAKKSEGGKFDFVWRVPAGLDDVIEVIAYRDIEFSSVRLSLQAD